MGCANSKLDDLPVVALCRDRCAFLDEAIRQRYIISQAHLHYFHSLKTVGASLNRFFDHLEVASADQPPSPLLNLPPAHRKAHPPQPSSKLPAPSSPLPPKAHRHSHSNSGSHINFHSDDDDDEDGDDADLHHLHHFNDGSSSSSGPSPPLHDPYRPQPEAYPPPPDTQHSVDFDYQRLYLSSSASPYYHGGDLGGNFQHMNFMRKQSTPSVTYQQRPLSPEIVRMGGGVASTSSSSHYPPPPYGPQHVDQANPNFYPTYINYSDIPGGSAGFLGSAAAPYYASSSSAALPIGAYSSSASTSKEPPPPPSPPRASAWEFFNLFEGSDKYYPQYTPSRDWREVREEEGIPDLEEEDYQQEVVKEVHGNQKFVDGSRGGGRISGGGKATLEDEGDGEGEHSEALYRPRPSTGMESDAAEYEVHVVEKKVVDDDEERANVAGFKNRGGGRFKGGSEVVREIQIQFERASESGNELAKILEVGKLPHNRKHAAYQVPSKMLHAIAPSLSVVSSQPSTSKGADNENADSTSLDAEGELNLKPKNLSSTLQKLYLWEKKLCEEVKVEEKMRILHERKCRKLKRLDERGAEAHKVDATRAMVESLSTKIRIAIQVVDKISVKISRLRDEELWPQLHELIQGLARMWKSMLECHHNQCQAILEAKHLDGIASHSSEAHIEVALQLEHEFISWAVGFSKWIGALKHFVRALNNWLMKCLLYVPEETPDGMAPFSPGRIGAPPVFVIFNQWNQAFDRVSEKEVVGTMRDFAASVHPWEWDKVEVRQRMTANKETERKMKNLEREDQRLQKEMQTLDKVMVVGGGNGLSPTGQVVYQSDTSKSSSLQVGLQRIFEAMERFTANSLKVHEELLQRIEEVLAREPEKVL
ncbi:uncharacterized protein [Coffea arabica]|uniref:Uncharacterized protein n=1 Tax=Coffea arabica TaxID=13443 RepID=A0A6P6UD72_COFAR|nr:nitrate regulatory gene2 protein-like [Coffea arabica]